MPQFSSRQRPSASHSPEYWDEAWQSQVIPGKVNIGHASPDTIRNSVLLTIATGSHNLQETRTSPIGGLSFQRERERKKKNSTDAHKLLRLSRQWFDAICLSPSIGRSPTRLQWFVSSTEKLSCYQIDICPPLPAPLQRSYCVWTIICRTSKPTVFGVRSGSKKSIFSRPRMRDRTLGSRKSSLMGQCRVFLCQFIPSRTETWGGFL